MKTRRKLRITLAILCIVFIVLSSLISGFYPVYLFRDNAIYIQNIPYRQDPYVNWQPKGEKYKIGNLCGDGSLFTFLYKYKGDDNQFFAYVLNFPSDAEALPYHRVDMPLPSFSADVIDSVNMSIRPDMTPGSTEYKEITVTDKTVIGEIADCFNHPVAYDIAKEIVGTSIGFTAQSSQFPNMTYKTSIVVYDGKYCFMQADESLFEIPQPLLETIFGLKLYSPEQYSSAIGR